jgi:hypothetical protein
MAFSRMREMLKITAEIEGDQLLHDGDLYLQ